MSLVCIGSSTSTDIVAVTANTPFIGWADQGSPDYDAVYFRYQGALFFQSVYIVKYDAIVSPNTAGPVSLGLFQDGNILEGSAVGALAANGATKISGTFILTGPPDGEQHLLTLNLLTQGAKAAALVGTGAIVANMTIIDVGDSLGVSTDYAFLTSSDNSTVGNGASPVPIGDWQARVSVGSMINVSSAGPTLKPGTYLIHYNATLRGAGRDTVVMGLVMGGIPVTGSVQAGYPSSGFESEQLSGSVIISVASEGLLSLAIWSRGSKIAPNSDTVSAQMSIISIQ